MLQLAADYDIYSHYYHQRERVTGGRNCSFFWLRGGGHRAPWGSHCLCNGCQLTGAAQWYSPVAEHLQLWFRARRVGVLGSLVLKRRLWAEVSWGSETSLFRRLHFLSLINFLQASIPSSGVFYICFKCLFLLQIAINWNVSRKVISFLKWLGCLEMSEFRSEWGQLATSAGAVFAPCWGLNKTLISHIKIITYREHQASLWMQALRVTT